MKSKNPNTLLSLLTVLAVAVTIVPSTALAVCPLDSSAYILLHPVFENTYRYATARTTNLFTTDTLCSSHPRAFAISRHQNFNVAAFIGRNDSLFVMRSENYNTVCAVTVEYLAPVQVASGLSFPATSPLFVLSQGKTTYDTTAIILASGPSTFEVLTVLTETGTVIQRTSKTVTMQVAGQTITNFNSSFNSATHRDTMLWVTGTKGMIRRFPISTTGIGSESSFDIASTQNVLCYGDGYAGTASGALFRL